MTGLEPKERCNTKNSSREKMSISLPLEDRRTNIGVLRVNVKVRKSAKIRNRYNQAPHLTQDTNGKVTNSQLYTTNES